MSAVIRHCANWPHIARVMEARQRAGLPTNLGARVTPARKEAA